MPGVTEQPCYPDSARYCSVTIEENQRIARDTYRLRFRCPEIARRIVPGQFVMLRLAAGDDPLLGRPLALYETIDGPDGTPEAVDVVYLVIGKLTRRLASCRVGEPLLVWGPLGNGFPPTPTEHLVMVAGGIGQTPFLALARECLGLRRYGEPARAAARAGKVTLCYGARSGEYLAGLDDFAAAGVDVRISTDDGSAGHRGLVTDLLRTIVADTHGRCSVVCCGPEPMMHAVANITSPRGIPCLVSLESPMACGLGICFSCVARVRQPDGRWDYRRTCIEGPVFPADAIEF